MSKIYRSKDQKLMNLVNNSKKAEDLTRWRSKIYGNTYKKFTINRKVKVKDS